MKKARLRKYKRVGTHLSYALQDWEIRRVISRDMEVTRCQQARTSDLFVPRAHIYMCSILRARDRATLCEQRTGMEKRVL